MASLRPTCVNLLLANEEPATSTGRIDFRVGWTDRQPEKPQSEKLTILLKQKKLGALL